MKTLLGARYQSVWDQHQFGIKIPTILLCNTSEMELLYKKHIYQVPSKKSDFNAREEPGNWYSEVRPTGGKVYFQLKGKKKLGVNNP